MSDLLGLGPSCDGVYENTVPTDITFLTVSSIVQIAYFAGKMSWGSSPDAFRSAKGDRQTPQAATPATLN